MVDSYGLVKSSMNAPKPVKAIKIVTTYQHVPWKGIPYSEWDPVGGVECGFPISFLLNLLRVEGPFGVDLGKTPAGKVHC